MEEYLSRLKDFRLFDKIETDQLPAMLKCLSAVHRAVRKSEFIFLDGDRLEQIGVLLKGSVYMIKEDIWGGKTILSSIGSGDLFGESFVCGGFSNSTVSFQAMTDCEILLLPFHKVICSCSHTCAFHQQLIENMVKIIARKNVFMLNQIDILSKKTIRERVLAWLSQQTQQSAGRPPVAPMGRTELAEYLCVDRSALTREIAHMEKDGLIRSDQSAFYLKKAKA